MKKLITIFILIIFLQHNLAINMVIAENEDPADINAIENSADNVFASTSPEINFNENISSTANPNLTEEATIDMDSSIAASTTPEAEDGLIQDADDVFKIETSSSTEDLIKASATSTNDADISSGNIMQDDPKTEMITGDIDIENIILNFINTNFSGDGKEYLINIYDKWLKTIDLSGFGGEKEEYCQKYNCFITVNNQSTSTIENSNTIVANTGKNEINSPGETYIQTGDINIINEIINIANINISGNDWFFAFINIFGQLDGDIILPGYKKEIKSVENENETTASASTQEYFVTNANSMAIVNEVIVNASTGGNYASATLQSLIKTGEINIDNKIFNFLNYNIFGKKWTLVKVNIFGDWQGMIRGLPEDYGYFINDDQVTIYNNFKNEKSISEFYAKLALAGFNNSEVKNKVNIEAETGGNSILHSDQGEIDTGNIDIRNILLNFINSNFIGDNWEFSMINVFGQWKGNLVFGLPDLWITESIPQTKCFKKGDYVTYTYLFGNSGDGIAENVHIVDDYDEDNLTVSDLGNPGKMKFLLGNLPPNSQGSISYTFKVKNEISYGEKKVTNYAQIFSNNEDREQKNNLTSGTVLIDGGKKKVRKTQESELDALADGFASLRVIKTNDSVGELKAGDKVNFLISINNTGTIILKDVRVYDLMKNDSNNEQIYNELWELDEVNQGEEINITYDLEIGEKMKDGDYLNQVIVEGYDEIKKEFISSFASTRIKVKNNEILIAQSATSAPILEYNLITEQKRTDKGGFNNEIILTNNSNLTAEDVEIFSILPEGSKFENASNTNNWRIGTISPGEIKNIKFKVKIDQNIFTDNYTYLAEVRGSNISPILKEFKIKILNNEQEKVKIVSSIKSSKEITNSDERIINPPLSNLLHNINDIPQNTVNKHMIIEQKKEKNSSSVINSILILIFGLYARTKYQKKLTFKSRIF